jgi:hypothetical protein
MLSAADAAVAGTVSGRLTVTYQSHEFVGIRQEYLAERFEATLRDRLFERNNLALTFYFDNADNLTTDATFRRYSGMLNLENRYYTFNARYEPKQTVSPLRFRPEQEQFASTALLDIHVRSTPRLRLYYGKRERYLEGAQNNELRELRADLTYTYKIFFLGLNRYQSESENASRRENTVTGGDFRVAHAVGRVFNFDAGYQYRLNEEEQTPGFPSDVTNHTLSGTFQGFYRRLLTATLALSRREIILDSRGQSKTTDDNDLLSLLFFPYSPVTFEMSRTFLRTETETELTRSDYGTAQVIARGNFWRRTEGRLQITKRADIDSYNGIIPDDIYYLSVRSLLYRGVDLRVDASVSERNEDAYRTDRFQTLSLLELYLQPWNNLTVIPRVQHLRFADDVSFTGNDRALYGVTANFHARHGITMGADLNRSLVTTGQQSESNSATFNLGLSLRKRSSVNLSYGINELDRLNADPAIAPDSKSRSFNVSGQVWVVPRGSLSMTFTDVDRDDRDDSTAFSVGYRQDF